MRLSRLHWGGGTPTLLAPDSMRELADAVFDAVPMAEGAEFSVEIDPNEIDAARLDALAEGDANWHIFMECDLLRLEKRADAILLTDRAIFVLEFKMGAQKPDLADLRQTDNYALDLHDFHAGSRGDVVKFGSPREKVAVTAIRHVSVWSSM